MLQEKTLEQSVELMQLRFTRELLPVVLRISTISGWQVDCRELRPLPKIAHLGNEMTFISVRTTLLVYGVPVFKKSTSGKYQ